jgi:hypothetical protein
MKAEIDPLAAGRNINHGLLLGKKHLTDAQESLFNHIYLRKEDYG